MGYDMIFDNILLAAWYTNPETWFSFAKAAFGLGLVIFVHELGHFLVAKACGVKCEKFYIGFDVPIKLGPITISHFWKQQWGETEYGIGVIPLGGYVKMLGQDDNPGNSDTEAERTHVRVENPDGTETIELDPRSYPAKNVPQRMAIISAGVIMNLIFAVIFASIAYGIGVKYTPCLVGSAVPGDPAWIAGMQPGDMIVGLSKDAPRREHLRFDKDLREAIVIAGAGRPLTLMVQRGDQTLPITIIPKELQMGRRKFPAIGIRAAGDLRVGGRPLLDHLPAGQASPPLLPNDLIVAITIAGERHPVESYMQYQALLAQHPEEAIVLTVERKPKDADEDAPAKRLDILVQSNPLRMLGVAMTVGPITAVQDGSLAMEAGLQIDDQLTHLNGQPIGDPVTLPQRLRELAGSPVTLTLQRGGATEEITLTPQLPTWYESQWGLGADFSINSLGITYQTVNKISAITPGGAAEGLGLNVGDEVLNATIIPPTPEAATIHKEQLYLSVDPVELGASGNWPNVMGQIQYALPDSRVKLTVKQGTQQKSVEITPARSDQWFFPERGIFLQPYTLTHEATSAGDAVMLGLRETKESVVKVIVFLKKVVTGDLAITNFGGPGMIAMAATMEASEGIPRLLIFLTLLSANLAVVNFLPIPVLDGGHMVFLAWEGIVGRPIDEKWMFRLSLAGLSFILCLMALVISLDVYNISGMFG